MQVLRKILIIVLSIAVIFLSGFAFINNYTQNNSGQYSSVTLITDNEREWIINRFGHKYESVEEYIITVQNYASQNFRYDDNKSSVIQYYDFNSIVDGNRINGICFDFAVLFKHITLVMLEENLLPVENVKVYVTDIRYKSNFFKTHSYNVIQFENGENYYLDLTQTATLGEKGFAPKIYYKKFKGTINDYADNAGEILYNLH